MSSAKIGHNSAKYVSRVAGFSYALPRLYGGDVITSFAVPSGIVFSVFAESPAIITTSASSGEFFSNSRTAPQWGLYVRHSVYATRLVGTSSIVPLDCHCGKASP